MKPYLFLLAFFFLIFTLPQERTNKLRAGFVAAVTPSWQKLNRTQSTAAIQKLQLENEKLRKQVEKLHLALGHEGRTQRLLEQAQKIQLKAGDAFYKRRLNYLSEIIQKQLQSLPARVIFREPGLWGSSLWLNVGEKDNRKLGCVVVAKNSPVLLGNIVVGVVEQVEETRSQVRLITDSTLAPSVRAVRGSQQNLALIAEIDLLLQHLAMREELPLSEALITQLKAARDGLDSIDHSLFLAKGTLRGVSHSKWRSRSALLKGVGFNCDFSDDEGEALNLRTGGVIQVGDLLVTTGLDGIFPADLLVATVAEILPLREGGCAYEIEALSLVPDFDELNEIFVIPPQV